MYYVHFGHVLSLLYAPMQECIEKYFLQYFTKAFSVLPNKCNTSNWSIIVFPSEGSMTDLMALYQYKKISLYRKNVTVVLQVLQKILSLLTSGQEKKVCTYQSTVF